MASSITTESRYFQLTPEILLEYVHYAVSTSVNEDEEDNMALGYDEVTEQYTGREGDTGTYPLYIMQDNYFGPAMKYVFNSGSNDSLNLINNSIDDGAVAIDGYNSTYAFLDTSMGGQRYNDLDAALTNTEDLIPYDENEIMEYDVVKFHFLAGYYFKDYDGLIFQLNTIAKNNAKVMLSSKCHLKTDDITSHKL
ncbi:MAG: hypothetical protein EOM87_06130 [Clostridia bacterium]|nr:hypothetical protein [Clostridia bacterium]